MKADALSRWTFDKEDYTLDRILLLWVKNQFAPWVVPQVDLFASPGNAQLEKIVTRWPHHQALKVDSLKFPLKDLGGVYANPPWTVTQPWLHRLRENPNLKCLLFCPYWVSTT